MMPSRATHIVTNCRISFFFYGLIIFHFIHTHIHTPLCRCAQLCATLWNFPGKITGIGCHFLLHPGIKPMSLASPALVGGLFTTEPSECVYLIAQLCPAVCDLVDSSLPGSFVHADSPGKNTGVGCHALLQGIFPTQGANPGSEPRSSTLQADSLPSKPTGRPMSTGVGSLQGIFLHCRCILYQLSHSFTTFLYPFI